MKLLYNIFIQLYSLTAKLLSFNNKKAKLWIEGRVHIFSELTKAFNNNTSPVIWMHCASLGEFEQGRPIIEKFIVQNSKFKVLITFFSPSGFEVQKSYTGANWIFYLPIDTAKNAKQFYEVVKPKLILFVKYEFWYHYISEAKARNIPLLLVSGIFREKQPFFKWYGKLYREMLNNFTYLFVQNQESFSLLKTIHQSNNIAVCGDTRFDRVIEIASQTKSFQNIENFISNATVIVAGSTWTEDDEELDHYANTHPEIKFIIAPHNVGSDRLTECLKLYKHSVLYSKIATATNDTNVLIIDNIGMLSTLYKYATICFVGGGFGGDGVHNVLEAAVYKKPILFGPEYEKYIEAIELIDANGAVSIDDALQLEQTLNRFINDETKTLETGLNAGNYVKNNSGATQEIVSYILSNFI
jgi:3-deoxy-D-manno-octulosonic-acid transferase